MKKILILCLLVLFALPLAAVDGDQVLYIGGTVATMKAGEIGQLDLTSANALTFEHAGNKLTIPYASLESFQYTHPVTHHLGVMPAIAARLVRARRHRHIFRIVYRAPSEAPQTVIFEVPKGMSETLNSVLEMRLHREGGQRPSRPACQSPGTYNRSSSAVGVCAEVYR